MYSMKELEAVKEKTSCSKPCYSGKGVFLDKIYTLSLKHPINRIGQLKILKLGMACYGYLIPARIFCRIYWSFD